MAALRDRISTRYCEYLRLGKIGLSSAIVTATIGVCAVQPRVVAHGDPEMAAILEDLGEPADCADALDEVTEACEAQLDELLDGCDAGGRLDTAVDDALPARGPGV